MKKLKQIVQSCFLTTAIISLTGCSSLKINNCLENSPLSILESQSTQILEETEIKEFYQQYFPSGKLEFSYKKTKTTKIRTFLRPNLKIGNETNYGMEIGIELKH